MHVGIVYKWIASNYDHFTKIFDFAHAYNLLSYTKHVSKCTSFFFIHPRTEFLFTLTTEELETTMNIQGNTIYAPTKQQKLLRTTTHKRQTTLAYTKYKESLVKSAAEKEPWKTTKGTHDKPGNVKQLSNMRSVHDNGKRFSSLLNEEMMCISKHVPYKNADLWTCKTEDFVK